MKITKRQLKRIIKEESQRLFNEAYDLNKIDANKSTGFYLGDETGGVEAAGDILNPDDLIKLAETLEGLYSGKIKPEGMVGFDLD
ncbi:MAG: hypothetical protein CML56_00900 [Rhodobacteraceae bacterium]|nr:hypothetical protein [Paracoccaceae bacterium]|tara:strand:- start:79 stop:333 length:255 start_codon:yes stop_codon:yes gene_type:complete